jgi:lipopolysaccharide transport system permease protein
MKNIAESNILHIAPSRGWVPLRLGELWTYRELIYFLTWRDIKVRYKQTLLGAAWAVIQPVCLMLVFTLFLGRIGALSTDNVPYPIFVYCGLLPWQLFAHALVESSNSLVANERLITKIYFPRLVIPLSTVLAGLLDFAIAFVVLIILLWYYQIAVTSAILLLPLFILLAVITALAVGLWLSGLNVRYRDVRHTLTFLAQFWMLATPVAYPASFVPEGWRLLLGLNPMAGVVEGFRWAVLGRGDAPGPMLGVSIAVALVVLVSGLYYFRRLEREFADVV